jgi:F-type H+-transporting ATPase subunit a
MRLEKTRKWRWGVNRWWVLAFIILTVIAINRFAPVQQVIAVAPENLTKSPIITLPLIGGVYLTNTEVAMVFMDLLILWVALVVKNTVKEETLIAKGFTSAMEMLIEVLYNLAQSTAGKWVKKIFPWFATIMIVVLFANMLKLLPGFESIGFAEEVKQGGYTAISLGGNWLNVTAPKVAEGGWVVVPFLRGVSTDLNFTLALALISVIMTQVYGVQAHGIDYFSKFLNLKTIFSRPLFGVIDLFTSLLEAISEFAKIISFTFRLFGNMFAGMVLMAIVSSMIPVFAPSAIMLFEMFIGLIQAFVFGMLTLVFMAMATQGHTEAEPATS